MFYMSVTFVVTAFDVIISFGSCILVVSYFLWITRFSGLEIGNIYHDHKAEVVLRFDVSWVSVGVIMKLGVTNYMN